VLGERFLKRYLLPARRVLPLDSKGFSREASYLLLPRTTGRQHPRARRTVRRARSLLTRPTDPRERTSIPARVDAGRPSYGERLPSLGRRADRAHIVRVLEAGGWNKKKRRAVLDISRGTLLPEDRRFPARPGCQADPGGAARESFGGPRSSVLDNVHMKHLPVAARLVRPSRLGPLAHLVPPPPPG